MIECSSILPCKACLENDNSTFSYHTTGFDKSVKIEGKSRLPNPNNFLEGTGEQ
jgi:hypothetical protein